MYVGRLILYVAYIELADLTICSLYVYSPQLNDLYPLSRLTHKLEKLNMSTPSSSADKEYPYTIELIKPEDADEVLAMLKTFFFKVRTSTSNNPIIIWEFAHIQIGLVKHKSGNLI